MNITFPHFTDNYFEKRSLQCSLLHWNLHYAMYLSLGKELMKQQPFASLVLSFFPSELPVGHDQ